MDERTESFQSYEPDSYEWDYEEAHDRGPRVLWGRIISLFLFLLLAFLVGCLLLARQKVWLEVRLGAAAIFVDLVRRGSHVTTGRQLAAFGGERHQSPTDVDNGITTVVPAPRIADEPSAIGQPGAVRRNGDRPARRPLDFLQ